MTKIQKTDEQWKKQLTPEQYAVLRQEATEAPYSGEYLNLTDKGMYVCAACGAELFDSGTKFDANCGWPSFYDAKPGAMEFHQDNTFGMARTAVTCATCGGHLGHIFDDAPDQPTGKRYCINSVGLKFQPRQHA
ncbi:MAG TPA: peptide-methionine (R)-S-oxide reductase MsrB [Candidatus Acidoferrum sp.]|nr:peptide-methionine (R)-S-oxide reductase MsrB [Candidatus Acidoferrum sp.]